MLLNVAKCSCDMQVLIHCEQQPSPAFMLKLTAVCVWHALSSHAILKWDDMHMLPHYMQSVGERRHPLTCDIRSPLGSHAAAGFAC